MTLSAAEQLLIELINRARLDPAAEARRLGTDLNEGLAPGTISTAAQQVLAVNDLINIAAEGHSQWMLDTDTFSHTGLDGSRGSDRMRDAGYVFQGNWKAGENIAMWGTTARLDLNAAITEHYVGLFHSEGHRLNTLNSFYAEIGVAQVEGRFRGYNTSMLTENFARSGTAVFLTGVAFQDGDGDDFYDIGEGRSGWWVSAATGRATTEAAGGYNMRFATPAEVSVTLGRSTAKLGALTLDLTEGNGKLDIVIDASGGFELALSASARLEGGIAAARLLGSAALDLTGSTGAERLTGNKAANTLSDGGGTGADVLAGGLGNDTYLVRSGATTVRESGGQGTDKVAAWVDWSLGKDVAVEVLTTNSSTGTAAIDLTGNALAQTITGNAGANVLSSGGGAADVLTGLGGNDTYRVYNAGDRIVEVAGGGTADRVNAAVSFALAADDDIEILATNGSTGTAAINLTGNGLGQTIIGNAGANRIDGRGGNDVLTGGEGADVFVFSAPFSASNLDRITDFNAVDDTIALDDGTFAQLAAGRLSASAFLANTTGLAADSADRVIYETDTGALWYDVDGTGAKGRVQVGWLDAGLKLTSADFTVI